MNMRFATLITIITSIVSTSFAQQIDGEETTENGQNNVNPSGTAEAGESLLYIVPADQIGSNGWQNAWQVTGDDFTGESGIDRPAQTNTDPELANKPFEDIFGEESVIVAVDKTESLFQLIASYTPEDSQLHSPFRIDRQRYRTIPVELSDGWYSSPAPQTIVLGWAEWWQTETNATPVVLILLRF